MILPNGNIGKFVKMTIGLIIILVIINPFIKLVQGDIDIEKEVFKNIEKQYNYREEDQSEFTFNQDEQIKTMYTDEIKSEIEKNIINKTKYKLSKINIEINESKDTEDYGMIETLELVLVEDINREDRDENNNEDNISKSSNTRDIEDININVSIETKIENKIENNENIKSKDQPEETEDSKEIEDIKRDISKQFEISKDKIFISLETKE